MVCAPVRRDNPRALARGLSTVQVHKPRTNHALTCTTISSVDLAQYGVALAKDWVSVECGTKLFRDRRNAVAMEHFLDTE